MKLYSYVVVSDFGFAPNPFHGVCTLVCCKPKIRKTCSVGDWIVGLTPKAKGDKLVYAMQVGKKLRIEEYWNDPAYKNKRVDLTAEEGRCGDNIYEPLSDGNWKQHPSSHSKCPFGEDADEEFMQHDLSGEYAVIGDVFVYYGASAIPLPEPLASALPSGRGHLCNFEPSVLAAWEKFIQTQPRGIHGKPGGDTSGDCTPGKCNK